MELLREKLKCRGGLGARLMGGDSSSSSTSSPVTTNTDKRVAVSGGLGLSGDGSSISTTSNTSFSESRDSHDYWVDNSNSPDAVVAMSKAGADIIKSSGGAVVELAKFQTASNTDAWNATMTNSVKLVDRLIDKVSDGFTLSSKVVDSFTPTETKNADIGKYAMIAAAAVAAAVLLKGAK